MYMYPNFVPQTKKILEKQCKVGFKAQVLKSETLRFKCFKSTLLA